MEIHLVKKLYAAPAVRSLPNALVNRVEDILSAACDNIILEMAKYADQSVVADLKDVLKHDCPKCNSKNAMYANGPALTCFECGTTFRAKGVEDVH